MKRIMIIALATCLFGATYGQDETGSSEEHTHRYVALGFRANVFQIHDLYGNELINKAMINVDPIKYARVDFQYGYNNFTNTMDYNYGVSSQTITTRDRNTFMGFGAFGMYWFEDMNIHLGFRYSVVKYSDEYVQYDWMNDTYSVEKDEQKRFLIGPALGGEYRFGTRFSTGGEVMFATFRDEDETTDEENTLIETSIFFRFYPF